MANDAVAQDQVSGDVAASGEPTTTTGAQDTGAAPQTGTVAQEQVDRIVQARLAREREQAQKREAELQARIQAYEQAEEERKAAEMTEVERAKAETAKARAEAQAAVAAAEQERLRATRADLIAQHAPDLPAAYKQLISGADEQAITESIQQAQASYLADEQAALDRVLALTPEQITARYGEEAAKAIAERLAGQPRSIGAPSAAGNQPASQVPAEFGEGNTSLEAWKRERPRLGLRPIPGMK